jgi:hypothetical protein
LYSRAEPLFRSAVGLLPPPPTIPTTPSIFPRLSRRSSDPSAASSSSSQASSSSDSRALRPEECCSLSCPFSQHECTRFGCTFFTILSLSLPCQPRCSRLFFVARFHDSIHSKVRVCPRNRYLQLIHSSNRSSSLASSSRTSSACCYLQSHEAGPCGHEKRYTTKGWRVSDYISSDSVDIQTTKATDLTILPASNWTSKTSEV